MMKLLEPIPSSIQERIQGVLPTEEEELIRVSTDLNPDGTFGTQWVVVTDKRVLVVPTMGTDGVVDVPIATLTAIRSEPFVGGGRLELERQTDAPLFIPYSSSLGGKFSEVERGIEQLRKGEPLLIKTELDKTRCEKCGRLLPEPNGICPACVRQLATLRRIAGYLKPYKGRATLLAIASIATTFSQLIPPMIIRRIVDDVLVPAEGIALSMEERIGLLGLLVLGLFGVRAFSGPLQWFGQVSNWMTRAFAGAERIFEVIDTPPEAYEDPDAVPMPNMEGRVAFQGVTFGYDKSKPVLHEIDLNVAPGEMIGLVGKSGVGKTTTVNLVARFYDVDRGAIEIDGVDIRKIRLEDLRRQIGIVPQEPFLFSGTIAENIGYGKPGAGFEEIMRAARIANAHNFIVAKPDGYDTQVGERGSRLSGGERQRVAIARAILHNPKILILDEATSSVDVETEKHIQDAIARLIQGRTTFAIAHRLSTLRNANRLVVLEGGRVVEIGTHSELMEKKGVFYNLVQLQQQVAEIIAVKE